MCHATPLFIADKHQLAGQSTQARFRVFTFPDFLEKLNILALEFSRTCLYVQLKFLPEPPVFGDLSLEGLCLLLQLGYKAKTLLFAGKTHITLGRNHGQVFIADLHQQFRVFFPIETAHGICAEQ